MQPPHGGAAKGDLNGIQQVLKGPDYYVIIIRMTIITIIGIIGNPGPSRYFTILTGPGTRYG